MAVPVLGKLSRLVRSRPVSAAAAAPLGERHGTHTLAPRQAGIICPGKWMPADGRLHFVPEPAHLNQQGLDLSLDGRASRRARFRPCRLFFGFARHNVRIQAARSRQSQRSRCASVHLRGRDRNGRLHPLRQGQCRAVLHPIFGSWPPDSSQPSSIQAAQLQDRSSQTRAAATA